MHSASAYRKLTVPLCLALLYVTTAGCAGSRGELLQYTNTDDIVEGPGLFTGEDGAFTMDFGTGSSGGADAGPSVPEGSDASYQEFQAFKRSRQAGEHGNGTRDEDALSREYQEFLQWKEWREFQDWKRHRGTTP